MCSWMAVHTLPRRAPGDQLSYHLVRGRGAMLSCCAITASCEVKKGHPAANAKFLLSGCVWCSQIQMEDATFTLLARLTGKAAVPRDDTLWQTLLTAKVPLQRGGSTSVADQEQITQNFCAQLLRNNAATGNFQTLLVCALDHLELAQAQPVTQAQLESACSAVMLVTIILRHMVETLEAEARPSAANLQPRARAVRTHTRERPCRHIRQNRVRSHSPRRTCCRTSSCRHRQTVRAPRSRRWADGSSRRC